MNIVIHAIAAALLAALSAAGSLAQGADVSGEKKQERPSAAQFDVKEFKELTAKIQEITENSARVSAKLDEMLPPKKQKPIDDMTAAFLYNFQRHGGADWLQMRKSYLDSNPEGIPATIVGAIAKGELVRGMTREHVFLAWAKIPQKVIKSVDASGRKERCVYDFSDVNVRSPKNKGTDTGRLNYPADTASTYSLDFVNGVLDGWQLIEEP